MSDLKANFDKLNNGCEEANEEWENMMKENNQFNTTSKITKDIADKRDKEIALEFAKYIGELFRENGVTAIIEEYRPGPTLKDKNLIEEYYGVAITGLDFTEHDKKFKDEIAQLKHDTKKMEDNIAKLKDKINNLRARCHKSAIDNFENGNYAGLFIVKADRLKNDNKVKELQCELDKTYNQLMEVEKDAQEQIAELEKTRSYWVDNAVAWKEKFEKAENEIKELESELEVKENLLKIKNGLCGNNDELPTDPIEVAQTLINSTFEREASNLEKVLYKCGDIRTVERYSIDDLEQIAEHLMVYCRHHREDED